MASDEPTRLSSNCASCSQVVVSQAMTLRGGTPCPLIAPTIVPMDIVASVLPSADQTRRLSPVPADSFCTTFFADTSQIAASSGLAEDTVATYLPSGERAAMSAAVCFAAAKDATFVKGTSDL